MWENLALGFQSSELSALKDALFLCPICVVISGFAGLPSSLVMLGVYGIRNYFFSFIPM